MATFTSYYPGPTINEEFATLTGLRDSIAANAVPYLNGAPPAPGSPPSGVWVTQGWGFVTAAAGPLLELNLSGQDGAAGNTWRVRFRFSTTLLGTLDPGLWLNGTDDPNLGKFDPFELQDLVARTSTSQVVQHLTDLTTILVTSGLCQGVFTLNTGAVRQVPNEGPSANLYHGVTYNAAYDPHPSETTSGFVPMYYDQFYSVGLAGINVSVGNLGYGTAVDATPVVVIQGGSQENNWNNLVDVSLTNLFVNNTSVTNSGDLGGPTPPSEEPAPVDVNVEVFANPGALVPLLDGTTAISELTTVASLVVAAIAGVAASVIGWLTNLGSWLGAATEIEGTLPDLVKDATFLGQASAATVELARIADALEAIQECICGTDTPVETRPLRDVLADASLNLQAVAETRQELHLKTKGIEVQAETGALITGP
jgi:hypothetical protein